MTDTGINVAYAVFLVFLLLRFYVSRTGKGPNRVLPPSRAGGVVAAAAFALALGVGLAAALSATRGVFLVVPAVAFAIAAGWAGDLAARLKRDRRA
ncbi:hypothetical protein ACFQ6N_17570 [Kitasatospora sp. NPDC056446]|uniref:hypothetical protein n=1 Tax=Kitasatospora sp. NPDC056446 TaxID=3345819 RepID=UPI003676A2A5